MRSPTLIAALLLLAGTGAGLAQEPAPGAAGKPDGQAAVGEPLQSGANSFTEAQVRDRFGRMGFGEITDLKKDESGIWRGTAVHAGKSVRIGMDFKGNVAAQ